MSEQKIIVKIVLTPEEQHAIENVNITNKNLLYYTWVGVLALRGLKLPLFNHQLPKFLDRGIYTYKYIE